MKVYRESIEDRKSDIQFNFLENLEEFSLRESINLTCTDFPEIEPNSLKLYLAALYEELG